MIADPCKDAHEFPHHRHTLPLTWSNHPSFSVERSIIDGVPHFLALPQDESDGERWLKESGLPELIKEPSTAWTTIYSTGDLGHLYVEILQCDNLPAVNLLNRTRKGNPSVTIVHEDSISTTDAIPDCANPRDLPWARRAFKLRIKHASSSLFLGVHDWSRETMASDRKHDALGRIAIQLTSSGLVPHITWPTISMIPVTRQTYQRKV